MINKSLIRALQGSKKRLTDVCEDLEIDYDTLVETGTFGIEQCSHCDTWTTQLKQDLDNNPICSTCEKYAGM